MSKYPRNTDCLLNRNLKLNSSLLWKMIDIKMHQRNRGIQRTLTEIGGNWRKNEKNTLKR